MFTFIETLDGSPTVRIGSDADPSGRTESMHSLRGAFSETLYIYGSAIEAALRDGFPTRVFSLGLGLGYVEILSAALFTKHFQLIDRTNDQSTSRPTSRMINPSDDGSMDQATAGGESFELIPELNSWFKAWTFGGNVPSEFSRCYDEILARTSTAVGIDAMPVKELLRQMLEDGRWKLNGPLDGDTVFGERFECICFDAFSSKTSPDLWTEDFLLAFFARAAARNCILSTYACTGALKRSLRASGFDLFIREGFSSKRDSTFAVRKFTN